jgi:hypothetical protein
MLVMEKASSEKKSHWWLVLVVILALGGVVWGAGHRYGLPMFDDIDEFRNAQDVLVARGLSDDRRFILADGYPPGITWVYEAVQRALETTGYPTPAPIAETIGWVRTLAVLLGLLIATMLAVLARNLAGDWAGWIAPLAWFAPAPLLTWVVIGLPQTWEATFHLSALSCAVACLRWQRPAWGVGSVMMGLGAVAFKYVAFPALGFGTLALLIGLWKAERSARRSWWLSLALALSLMTSAGLGLVSHALQIVEADHTETKAFLEGGLSHLLQPQYGLHVLDQASAQVGTHSFVWGLCALVGFAALRQHLSSWRWWTWTALVTAVLFHFWLMPTYLWWQFLVPRYSVPMSAFIILIVVCGLVWGLQGLGRTKYRVAAQVAL